MSATYTAATETFGKKQGSSQNDRYALYAEKMDPHIQAKRAVLHKYKDSSTAQSQEALTVSRANNQTAVRLCINQYWLDSCSSSQIASDTGNIKAMYDDIKKLQTEI